MDSMNLGSLFSGGGGFEIAGDWIGWDVAFHCEWNPFGRKVLKYYWPHAKSYEDITKTDFTIWRGRIDVLTGGFPCQPFSLAGKRGGEEDNRFLWPEYLRAIREIEPTWIVAENVPGILTIERGMVFERVCLEMEAEGYEVQPVIIPSVATGADHRRERVFFIAYSERNNDLRKKRRSFELQEGIQKLNRSSDGSTGQPCRTIELIIERRNIEQYDDTNSESGERYEADKEQSSTIVGETRKTTSWGDRRSECHDTDTNNQGLEKRESKRRNNEQKFKTTDGNIRREHWLEAATRLCFLPNVISGWMDRNIRRLKITNYAESFKNISRQDMPVLWEAIQSDAVWKEIRMCNPIQKQEVLFAIMRKLKYGSNEDWLSTASEEISQTGEMFNLWYDRKFGDTSYQRELERQLADELTSIMSQLSHEIALDGLEIYSKVFDSKWRTESLKMAGNAVDPDVVYEIFKAIQSTYN